MTTDTVNVGTMDTTLATEALIAAEWRAKSSALWDATVAIEAAGRTDEDGRKQFAASLMRARVALDEAARAHQNALALEKQRTAHASATARRGKRTVRITRRDHAR